MSAPSVGDPGTPGSDDRRTGQPPRGPESSVGPVVPLDSGEHWIETREGGWFFVNAVLVAPALMVAFPWCLRAVFRLLGLLSGPNPFFDTIPVMAAYAVPYVGWLAAIPLWLTWRSLRWEAPRGARIALRFFGLVHLCVLAYAAWWWLFSRTFPPVR